MNLKEDATRGEKAQRLLDDPIVVEAFDLLRAAIFRQMEQCPMRDEDGLRQLKMMLKLSNDLRRNFEEIIRTGKLAELQIEQEYKPTWLERLRSVK